MKMLRIAVTVMACLLAATACSKEGAHEEPVAEEAHGDVPPVDATADQDAQAAIAAAMAASPTALEAPGAAASSTQDSTAASSPPATHGPAAANTPAH